MELDLKKLHRAFEGSPAIIGAVKAAAGAPEWIELFNVINSYVCDLRESTANSEPATKKRKLDDSLSHKPVPGTTNGASSTPVTPKSAAAGSAVEVNEKTLLQVKEISFVLPQRKKYTIEFTPTHIVVRNPQTQELVPGVSYAWQDISGPPNHVQRWKFVINTSPAYAFCLPVPEKTAKQYSYILFPRNSHLPCKAGTPVDPLLFTIPATAPKPGSIGGSESSAASAYSDTHKDVFDWAITARLRAVGSSVTIEAPSEKQFTSTIKEAHRPNEKAMFVKGFRGSKDGYLFFLATGILFCFKKPVLFIPKEQVVAVSYTSVLQRTFNLNIEVALSRGEDGNGVEGEEEEEFEFAMLDQEDFDGIDTYIKRHGLQDKSMAEQRKAKRLGVNDVKGEDGKVIEAETGELDKAQQELQDEEEDEDDEEEEDYDPGSEGESEGSGSDTDDEDEDGDGAGDGGGDNDDDDDDDEEIDEVEVEEVDGTEE